MDIVANLFGATVGHSMLMRNVPSDQLVVDVAQWANYIPAIETGVRLPTTGIREMHGDSIHESV